jgi:hypothetical protein
MKTDFAYIHFPKKVIVTPSIDSAFVFDKKTRTFTICSKYFKIKYCPFSDEICILIERVFNHYENEKLYKCYVDTLVSQISVLGDTEHACNQITFDTTHFNIKISVPECARNQKYIILYIKKLILTTVPYCKMVTTCNVGIATVQIPEKPSPCDEITG